MIKILRKLMMNPMISVSMMVKPKKLFKRKLHNNRNLTFRKLQTELVNPWLKKLLQMMILISSIPKLKDLEEPKLPLRTLRKLRLTKNQKLKVYHKDSEELKPPLKTSRKSKPPNTQNQKPNKPRKQPFKRSQFKKRTTTLL